MNATETTRDTQELERYINLSELSASLRRVKEKYIALYLSHSDECLPNEQLADDFYHLNLVADFFEGKKNRITQ